MRVYVPLLLHELDDVLTTGRLPGRSVLGVTRALRAEGFDTVDADDGQAALDRARTRRPGPSADAGGPVAVERRILNLLGPSPTDENMLIRDLGLTAAVVSAAILNLELAGRIVRVPGGRVALT